MYLAGGLRFNWGMRFVSLALSWLALVLWSGCGGPSAPPPSRPPPPPPVVVVQEGLPDDPGASPRDADDGTITVSSPTRLLKALGNDRVIRLRPGDYDLGAIAHEASGAVRWEKVHDGEELVISDVENLTIEAADPEHKPRILARPRYAFVLRLQNVKNVTLRNLVLGHTEAGHCQGGVVRVEQAEQLAIESCDLFGSGTVGVSLEGVRGFLFDQSAIRECTYGIAEIAGSSDVAFNRSTFSDNAEFDLVTVAGTPNVRFMGSTFSRNRITKGYGHHFFEVDGSSRVVLANTAFTDNDFERLTNDPTRLVVTGPQAKGWAAGQLHKPNPEYNQVYDLVRYRQWVVAGTQAGVVFWNPKTGMVDKLVKAYIAGQLLVRGQHLWVGAYRRVLRFDGLDEKSYRRSSATRGGQLVEGPAGVLFLGQDKSPQLPNHWWRFEPKTDRFVPDPTGTPQRLPDALGGVSLRMPHDVIVRQNGEVWVVDFLKAVVRHVPGQGQGQTTVMPRNTAAYPGSDPRRFYVDPRGQLWVEDFDSGYYRWDDAKRAFFPESPVTDKGTGVRIDRQRGRRWFLHYTSGVHLLQKGQPNRFFDLSRMEYLRSMMVDKDGSAWIAGWHGIVRLSPQGAQGFRERTYVVDATTVSP